VCHRVALQLSALLLVLPLLAGGEARPGARVLLLDHGRVGIQSESAPLADILTRFAQVTGAEVVYEAARPRQLVSVAIEAGSPAEAITRLLEGQGLNYALRLDPTGKNVEMLVVTGSASSPAAAAGTTRAPRSFPPAAPSLEEATEFPSADVDQPFAPDVAPEGQEASAPPATSPDEPMNPALNPGLGPPWPGAAPGVGPGGGSSNPESTSGAPTTSASPTPEPGQPQVPGAASYPGSPVSPQVPPRPVYPGPASY
jgi:hypothetical protein